MINEAIILAGGLGTRLRSSVPDLPKCMAPVAGTPFLHYVLKYLQQQGIDKFIFSLGYKSEVIEEFLSDYYPLAYYQNVIEQTPLGTGGAIKLACEKATEKNVLVLNGDTLFSINTSKLSAFHKANKADCTLSLKPMTDFERYGVVEINQERQVTSFKEKQFYNSGLINGGVYALNVKSFLKESLPEQFSFEKDYLEKFYTDRHFFGLVQDEYFIDIGIPEDFERAGRELAVDN